MVRRASLSLGTGEELSGNIREYLFIIIVLFANIIEGIDVYKRQGMQRQKSRCRNKKEMEKCWRITIHTRITVMILSALWRKWSGRLLSLIHI